MKLAIIVLLVLSQTVMASKIAIIDSGTDVEHIDLVSKIWKNVNEIENNGRDDDRNGYQDDIYGWNFAESNNLVIDRKYVGTFSADPYLFFEIQGKMFLGTATEAELKWVGDKRQDPLFLKEMQIFGNFVHGTHVAGIAAKDNVDASILSVKLIPTEVSPFFNGLKQSLKSNKKALSFNGDDLRMKILKAGLTALANQQMMLLEEIAAYVGNHGADIANGSFGTGFNQSKMITDNAFKLAYQREPTEEESDKLARYFMNSLITAGKQMVNAAPKTLFVFAAGNDGSNNDKFPTSPTNIEADNVISVAATYENQYLAPFSNYGVNTVDIAAPGMLIHSQIPGNEYLDVSGTSQAAPRVANIAAVIKDINPSLKPIEIKKILMGTVDLKSYLVAKVKSKGILNSDRASYAAKLSLTSNVDLAIQEARTVIMDEETRFNKSGTRPFVVTPIPLINLFQ